MFEMNVEKLNILNPKWIYTNSETDFPLNYLKKDFKCLCKTQLTKSTDLGLLNVKI